MENFSKLYQDTLDTCSKILADKSLSALENNLYFVKKCLENAVEILPNQEQARLLLAKTYLLLGDKNKAIFSFQIAIAINPSLTEASLGLADCLELKEGIHFLDSALENISNKSAVYKRIISKLISANDLVQAKLYLDRWSVAEPESLDVFLYLAKLSITNDQPELAYIALQTIIAAEPNNYEAQELYLKIISSKRSKEETIKAIDEFIKRFSFKEESLVFVANLLEEMGKKENALSLLRQYLEQKTGTEVCLAYVNSKNKLKQKVDEKLVLLVAEYPRGRIFKIAKGLKDNGFKTVLLCCYNHTEYNSELYFDEVRLFNNAEHAISIALEYSPKVCHVFSSVADEVSVAFCKYKPAKIVFDPYDYGEGVTDINLASKFSSQLRYCFLHADALCLRDLRAKYYQKKHNFNLPKKLIFYPDYCWNNLQQVSKLKDGIHVAMAGFISTPQTKETDWGILNIAERLCGHSIYFHLYPHPMQAGSPSFQNDFKDFINYSKQNKFFKLHSSTKMDELVLELSQYHFGINTHWSLVNNESILNTPMINLSNCSSARNFDYLDSELLVILNKNLKFQNWLLNRFDLSIISDLDFFKNPKKILEQKLSQNHLAQKIKQAKYSYSIERNIDRLINFYSSL